MRLPLSLGLSHSLCRRALGPTLARRAFVAMAEPRPLLRGVVFDMDGTLTNPNLDFGPSMPTSIAFGAAAADRSQDILEALAQMPAAEAAAASAIVEEMEEEGRRTLALAPGTVDVLQWLKERGIRTAVVTRNTIRTVGRLHRVLEPSGLPPFWPCIARDAPAGVPPKPDTAALALIAAAWGVPLGPELLMVGDSPANDIAFGAAAPPRHRARRQRAAPRRGGGRRHLRARRRRRRARPRRRDARRAAGASSEAHLPRRDVDAVVRQGAAAAAATPAAAPPPPATSPPSPRSTTPRWPPPTRRATPR